MLGIDFVATVHITELLAYIIIQSLFISTYSFLLLSFLFTIEMKFWWIYYTVNIIDLAENDPVSLLLMGRDNCNTSSITSQFIMTNGTI